MMDLLLVAVANISSALEKMGIDIIFTIPLIMLGTFQLRPKIQKGHKFTNFLLKMKKALQKSIITKLI